MKDKRKTLGPPRTAWESTLEETEAPDRWQAGELEPGDEDRGGGDKGLDADTGDGGYGGDAALAGYEESLAQPDRPLDRELQGDPRTREGESYPDEAKAIDADQGPIGEDPALDEDEEDGLDEEDEEDDTER